MNITNTVSGIFVAAYLIAGCSSTETPEQINARTNQIVSVVATTGQVITPLIVTYANGQSVAVQQKQSVKVQKPKSKPTPKP